jgi:hypothetical protein
MQEAYLRLTLRKIKVNYARKGGALEDKAPLQAKSLSGILIWKKGEDRLLAGDWAG